MVDEVAIDKHVYLVRIEQNYNQLQMFECKISYSCRDEIERFTFHSIIYVIIFLIRLG